jgi:hypothetical protein
MAIQRDSQGWPMLPLLAETCSGRHRMQKTDHRALPEMQTTSINLRLYPDKEQARSFARYQGGVVASALERTAQSDQ